MQEGKKRYKPLEWKKPTPSEPSRIGKKANEKDSAKPPETHRFTSKMANNVKFITIKFNKIG